MKIFKMSLLPTLTMVFHPMYQIVNSIFLSKVDNATQLQAAFGLGQMFINLFMQSIAISFTINVSTFIGQAHGQKQPELCAIYLRRQQIISALFWIPWAILLCFSQVFSTYVFGMDEAVTELAYIYILAALPGFFFLTQYTILSSYCNAQKEMVIPIYATVGGFFIHLALLYILVDGLNMGLLGVGISTSVHFLSRFVIADFFIRRHERFAEQYKKSLWSDAR